MDLPTNPETGISLHGLSRKITYCGSKSGFMELRKDLVGPFLNLSAPFLQCSRSAPSRHCAAFWQRWAVIACQLKDKTSRQCRRRWHTYLSTAYKKGGWSPEEDRILFEAHKKFGNRWTEIAKVVQGRTDNAVKNRFSALCKKQAKREESSKENDGRIGINENNKRVTTESQSSISTPDSTKSCKKTRNQFVSPSEGIMLQSGVHAMRIRNNSGTLPRDTDINVGAQVREPESLLQSRAALAVLPNENLTSLGLLGSLGHYNLYNEFAAIKRPMDQGSKAQRTFLEKDDPRLSALTQQAELLSSLVQRRNAEISNEELENAWKALDGILAQGKGNQLMIKDHIKDQIPCSGLTTNTSKTPRSDKEQSQIAICMPSKRQHMPALPNLCEPCEKISQESSQFSVGSTYNMDLDDKSKHNLCQTETSAFGCTNKSFQTSSPNTEGKEQVPTGSEDGSSGTTAVKQAILSKQIEQNEDERLVPISSIIEYCSPMRVTPFFRFFVDGIPSPQFSDSERQFLLSALDPNSETPLPGRCLPSRRSSPLCRASLSNRL
eukprot:Gb_06045 [translate_table: standard]